MEFPLAPGLPATIREIVHTMLHLVRPAPLLLVIAGLCPLPGHAELRPSAVPGGVVALTVAPANTPRPVVRFGGRPVLLQHGAEEFRRQQIEVDFALPVHLEIHPVVLLQHGFIEEAGVTGMDNVDGQVVAGTSGREGVVWNPATGEQQAAVDLASAAEVDAAVAVAKAAIDGRCGPGESVAAYVELLGEVQDRKSVV